MGNEHQRGQVTRVGWVLSKDSHLGIIVIVINYYSYHLFSPYY